MKPTPLVADEMFPEGAGRYLAFEMVTDNMEEIVIIKLQLIFYHIYNY
jgi:hypothetical protein